MEQQQMEEILKKYENKINHLEENVNRLEQQLEKSVLEINKVFDAHDEQYSRKNNLRMSGFPENANVDADTTQTVPTSTKM